MLRHREPRLIHPPTVLLQEQGAPQPGAIRHLQDGREAGGSCAEAASVPERVTWRVRLGAEGY